MFRLDVVAALSVLLLAGCATAPSPSPAADPAAVAAVDVVDAVLLAGGTARDVEALTGATLGECPAAEDAVMQVTGFLTHVDPGPVAARLAAGGVEVTEPDINGVSYAYTATSSGRPVELRLTDRGGVYVSMLVPAGFSHPDITVHPCVPSRQAAGG